MSTHPILLVIDVQNGFVNEHSRHVVPIIRDLAEQWTNAGGATLFTRYHNYEGSPYQRLIGWNGLREAPQTDLVPDLRPLADAPGAQVLDKVTYTALTDDGRRMLTGYTDLYICGIATDGCVLKTALDAFDSGYTPWIIEDACASNATRHPAAEVHQSALTLLSRLIGSRQLVQSPAVREVIATAPTQRHSA
ncbi:isochorismatase family cysteine hydrolase [Nocardia sp. NPDC050697]|uniref:cysteine hydrolase family protein n=1 Tax=Nocardia sp. NPDC050697 TaxID=3155158 RepID=UPI0033DD94D5